MNKKKICFGGISRAAMRFKFASLVNKQKQAAGRQISPIPSKGMVLAI